MNLHRKQGFTLVELLVVIAIIGVLVAMSIPAVQASREMGRRAVCQSNLGQVMLALQSYDNAFETLPSGVVNPDGPIRNEATGLHQGWLIQMLPYLDQQAAFRAIVFSASVYDPVNAPVRNATLPVFICPSDPGDRKGMSNYAGCHHDVEAPIAADNQGVLFLNSRVGRDDIVDGSAFTIFVGEKLIELNDLGWMSGTRATLRNTGPTINALETQMAAEGVVVEGVDPMAALLQVGGFASAHINGAFVGFGDGSTRYVSEDIDLTLWHRLGNRADGTLLELQLDE